MSPIYVLAITSKKPPKNLFSNFLLNINEIRGIDFFQKQNFLSSGRGRFQYCGGVNLKIG
jgi:hypothetical protein